MVLIYIRHGDDYINSHEHDERLTSKGKYKSYNFGLELVEKYGIPDIIYHSPYYRTRQTAKLFVKSIYKKHNVKVDREVDPKLGRYFNNKEKRNPDVKRSTERKGAIIYETYNEFKIRVNEQLEEKEKFKNEKNIWCITHNLVIRKIYNFKEIEKKHKYVDYLEIMLIE